MTDGQKMQIKELRAKGIGYTRISMNLQSKNFLSENFHFGYIPNRRKECIFPIT